MTDDFDEVEYEAGYERRYRTREALDSVAALREEVHKIPIGGQERGQLLMKLNELEALLRLWGLYDD